MNNTTKKIKVSDQFSVLSLNSNVVVVNKGAKVEQESLDELSISPEYQKKFEEELNKCAADYENKLAELKNRCEEEISSLQRQIAELEKQNELLTKKIPESLSKYFTCLENQIKEEICEISFLIAEIILKEELSHKDILKSLIQEVLGEVNTVNNLKLYISPEYTEKMKRTGEYGLPPGIEIIPDSNLKSGEIILKSPQGIVDATIKERLKNVKEKICEFFERSKEGEI